MKMVFLLLCKIVIQKKNQPMDGRGSLNGQYMDKGKVLHQMD